MSATPGPLERERSQQIVEQIIRPTGLLDPEIEVRPVEGQIDNVLSEINLRADRGERVLVTTLTKKMAEDLTAYLENLGVRVRYMHHDVDTIERMEIVRDLRLGEFDVLIGINLLREGLDIPEVSLVAIFDADKEGFLRHETALIQTIGRAARNAARQGDHVRRPRDGFHGARHYRDAPPPGIQKAYTRTRHHAGDHQKRGARDTGISSKESVESGAAARARPNACPPIERETLIKQLTLEMRNAAKLLEFEHAAYLRDRIDASKRDRNRLAKLRLKGYNNTGRNAGIHILIST